MKYISVLLFFALCGCAITRQTHIHLEGNNIKTPYGTGDVNSEYDANTTYSFGCANRA